MKPFMQIGARITTLAAVGEQPYGGSGQYEEVRAQTVPRPARGQQKSCESAGMEYMNCIECTQMHADGAYTM